MPQSSPTDAVSICTTHHVVTGFQPVRTNPKRHVVTRFQPVRTSPPTSTAPACKHSPPAISQTQAAPNRLKTCHHSLRSTPISPLCPQCYVKTDQACQPAQNTSATSDPCILVAHTIIYVFISAPSYPAYSLPHLALDWNVGFCCVRR